MAHEAIINGYLRNRERSREFVRARNENRKPDEPMVTQHHSIHHGAGSLDRSSGRRNKHGYSVRFYGRSPSEIFDNILTFACYSAWGAIVGIGIVVVIKVVESL